MSTETLGHGMTSSQVEDFRKRRRKPSTMVDPDNRALKRFVEMDRVEKKHGRNPEALLPRLQDWWGSTKIGRRVRITLGKLFGQ